MQTFSLLCRWMRNSIRRSVYLTWALEVSSHIGAVLHIALQNFLASGGENYCICTVLLLLSWQNLHSVCWLAFGWGRRAESSKTVLMHIMICYCLYLYWPEQTLQWNRTRLALATDVRLFETLKQICCCSWSSASRKAFLLCSTGSLKTWKWGFSFWMEESLR